MKFTDNMITASKDARAQVIEILAESKRKAFLQDVLGEIKFIGDEIPRTELERVLEVNKSTATRFIKANQAELEEHGYHVVEGAQNVKSLVEDVGMDAHIFKQTVRLGLFTIDAALSFAMSLTGSEPAKRLRTALIELTKVSTPEQLQEASARAWELRDFRDIWERMADVPEFNKWDGVNLQRIMFTAVVGMTSTKLKETRQQIHPGDPKTARNYMTDEELIQFSNVERMIISQWFLRKPKNSSEMYYTAKAVIDQYTMISNMSID